MGQKLHLSCVRTVSNVANKITDLRGEIVDIDPLTNTPVHYLGQASKIYKFKLPITPKNANCLFTAISLDPSLNKTSNKRKTRSDKIAARKRISISDGVNGDENDDIEDEGENDDEVAVVISNSSNPGRNIATCSVQHL